jgi:hypothetical protein
MDDKVWYIFSDTALMVIVGIFLALKSIFISSDSSFFGSAAKYDPIFVIAA